MFRELDWKLTLKIDLLHKYTKCRGCFECLYWKDLLADFLKYENCKNQCIWRLKRKKKKCMGIKKYIFKITLLTVLALAIRVASSCVNKCIYTAGTPSVRCTTPSSSGQKDWDQDFHHLFITCINVWIYVLPHSAHSESFLPRFFWSLSLSVLCYTRECGEYGIIFGCLWRRISLAETNKQIFDKSLVSH